MQFRCRNGNASLQSIDVGELLSYELNNLAVEHTILVNLRVIDLRVKRRTPREIAGLPKTN